MGIFNWRTKNKSGQNFEWGIHIDIHNHILPALDDGSPDISTSHILLDGLEELGFTHSVSTPHIAAGIYHNDSQSIAHSFQSLKDSFLNITQENNVSEPNHLSKAQSIILNGFASEYMLDDQFYEWIEKGLITYPSTGQYVLVEFPYLGKPPQWHELVFEMLKKRYQPILAHPERYQFISPEYLMETLMPSGFKFQLNLLSLSGYYGPKIKQLADIYLNAGIYEFVGTDMHHMFHLEALRKMKQDEKISNRLSAYEFQNDLLISN